MILNGWEGTGMNAIAQHNLVFILENLVDLDDVWVIQHGHDLENERIVVFYQRKERSQPEFLAVSEPSPVCFRWHFS